MPICFPWERVGYLYEPHHSDILHGAIFTIIIKLVSDGLFQQLIPGLCDGTQRGFFFQARRDVSNMNASLEP